MCRVYTEDNQRFVVALNKWFIWSDGTPVSIEDLYFTYNDIIRTNKRNISWLNSYKDIIITKEADNKLTVSFPTPSKDNIFFFSHYIVPEHILRAYDLENYKKLFGVRPVYTNCANVVTDSVDPYSLIFNLANCQDSNLNFYQIKNAGNFDSFQKTTPSANNSIIDAYIWATTIKWYVSEPLVTNKLVTVFFNTNSNKLFVRVRRVLGWLIKHNFYTTGYELFMTKNTDGLFDVFQSTWANVKDLLNRDYSAGTITKSDLLDINVQPLPASVPFTSEGQKSVYFVETGSKFPLKLNFAASYDRISLEYKGKLNPLTYNKSTKTAEYTISAANNNFTTWLNKYTLYGYVKKTKKIIGSLDIYNMLETGETEVVDETATGNKVQLTVIYFDNPTSNFIAERMQNIFRQANILENFTFQKMTTPEELQGRLFAGDYDVLISVVDMWDKKDFTKLFGTDKSELNPSQYQNQKLTELLSDYMNSNSSKQLHEINAMYSKDMPFVILGNVFTKLNIKSRLADLLRGTWTTNVTEASRRTTVYKKLQLVSSIHIDGKRVRSWSNFVKFLQNSMK